MRRLIKLLVAAIIATGAAGYLTNPDREGHIRSIARKTLSDITGPNIEPERDFTKTVYDKAAGLIEPLIDRRLIYENKLFYSVGKIVNNKEAETVSVGIMGHVFNVGRHASTEFEKELTALINRTK